MIVVRFPTPRIAVHYDRRRNGKAKIPHQTESGRKEENMKIDTNKYYIVRGDRSGVFFGKINYQDGKTDKSTAIIKAVKEWRA